MTSSVIQTFPPAVLGGAPAFADGVPLVRPTIRDIPALARHLETILASGTLTSGPTVRTLEEAIAERLGVSHVVAVSSCTAGLMLVLQALDARGPVVMPSFTFSASAHAVVWAGGTPAWADVDPARLTLDPAQAAAAATEATVAITATHVYGAPCQVEDLQNVADARRIPLVYDAAHALGSSRNGQPVGRFGTAEVFSLSPTKVVVAGEGGLVATTDSALADAVRIGRDYGNPGDYDCVFPGLNARLSELHAAVALAGLGDLDERIAHRNALVRIFKSTADGLPGLTFQHVDAPDLSTYKDLTVVLDPAAFGLTAQQTAVSLRAEGIDTRRYYSPPIHRQKAYAHLPTARALPVTDRLAEQVLTLPLWSHMEETTVTRLATTLARLQHAAPAVRDHLESHRLGGSP